MFDLASVPESAIYLASARGLTPPAITSSAPNWLSGNPEALKRLEGYIQQNSQRGGDVTGWSYSYSEKGPLGIPALTWEADDFEYSAKWADLNTRSLSLATQSCSQLDIIAKKAGAWGPECKVTKFIEAPTRGQLSQPTWPSPRMGDYMYTAISAGTDRVRFILENGAGKQVDVTVKIRIVKWVPEGDSAIEPDAALEPATGLLESNRSFGLPNAIASSTTINLVEMASQTESVPTTKERAMGVCHPVDYNTLGQQYAAGALNPEYAAATYFGLYEKRLIDQPPSSSVELLASPKNGKIVNSKYHGGSLRRDYVPAPGYVGDDRLVFKANVDGAIVRLVYVLKVTKLGIDTDGIQDVLCKKTGGFWKISLPDIPLDTPIVQSLRSFTGLDREGDASLKPQPQVIRNDFEKRVKDPIR